MEWHEYFLMMQDWKKLPAYRMEPRIDSYIGYFLPAIAKEFLSDEIMGIIPELPIRLGTIKPELQKKRYADLSYKVDFYLLGSSGSNYFLEFKSDNTSRRDKQDVYLKEASQIGMKKIVNGILKISSVSTYIQKYSYLLDKLKTLKILNEDNMYTGRSDEIKIIYLQPRNEDNEKNCIEFLQVAEWLERNNGKDGFESYFASALRMWAMD